MIAPAAIRSTCEWSRSLFSKKLGTVIELFAISVYARSRGATNFQFSQAPTTRPITIHDSNRPEA